MTQGEGPLSDEPLYVFGEGKQAQRISNRGSVLSYGLGDLLMGQSKIIDELSVAFRLFDGVEVLALEVFDEGEREQLLVGNVPNDGGNRSPTQSSRCPKTPLARNEFVLSVLSRSHGDRLEKATGLQAELEFLKLNV